MGWYINRLHSPFPPGCQLNVSPLGWETEREIEQVKKKLMLKWEKLGQKKKGIGQVLLSARLDNSIPKRTSETFGTHAEEQNLTQGRGVTSRLEHLAVSHLHLLRHSCSVVPEVTRLTCPDRKHWLYQTRVCVLVCKTGPISTHLDLCHHHLGSCKALGLHTSR